MTNKFKSWWRHARANKHIHEKHPEQVSLENLLKELEIRIEDLESKIAKLEKKTKKLKENKRTADERVNESIRITAKKKNG